jgi:hypothetical protein
VKESSTFAKSVTEQITIREAQRQGVEEIIVNFNGHPTPMCGVCGRIVCHPECPRGRGWNR